nr:immunoglobulin heavy chain junction region [Macaca mulatta]MOW86478.1 immunoglobulin heavy chain junction region [Macaca mulatta]
CARGDSGYPTDAFDFW